MSDIMLYGHADSGHACKVALALALAGVVHRTDIVDYLGADHPATGSVPGRQSGRGDSRSGDRRPRTC